MVEEQLAEEKPVQDEQEEEEVQQEQEQQEKEQEQEEQQETQEEQEQEEEEEEELKQYVDALSDPEVRNQYYNQLVADANPYETGITPLRAIAAGLDFLLSAVGYRNPQMVFQQVVSLQLMNPDAVAGQLKDLGDKLNNDYLKELGDIYVDASTSAPLLLFVIGTLQKQGLEKELLPLKEHIEAAKITLGPKAKDLSEEQLATYAMAMLGKEFREALPFMGSEKLSAKEIIYSTLSEREPFFTRAGITKIRLPDVYDMFEKIGGLREGKKSVSPYVISQTPSYLREISVPS